MTHVVGGGIAPLASGLCLGAVRFEEEMLRLSDLRLMLDFTDSQVFAGQRLDLRSTEPTAPT